jgi:cell cycle arrest protein BUB3
MKLYPKFPTSISALAFSPDGTRLAIGASYEHDNAVGGEEKGKVLVLIKDTVMDDCRVGLARLACSGVQLANSAAKSQGIDCVRRGHVEH